MLDILPQDLFRRPDTTFLDPVCKSGVFLREIARRLNDGLKDQMPDEQARIDHILAKQVFGLAITELTSLISRRSVYCSKKADGKFSIATAFKTSDGNIRLPKTGHTWTSAGRCEFCGASKGEYDRDESLEEYAYPFIHGIDPRKVFNVKFEDSSLRYMGVSRHKGLDMGLWETTLTEEDFKATFEGLAEQ